MPKLHILSPASLAATIELTESLITIGRTPENSICIQDTNVSRRHGILVRDGDNYQLHDFKSSNGTFVNGEQIMAAKLKDGASIRFGSVELRYESGLAKAAPLGVAQADHKMLPAPPKGASGKDRGGMSKRTNRNTRRGVAVRSRYVSAGLHGQTHSPAVSQDFRVIRAVGRAGWPTPPRRYPAASSPHPSSCNSCLLRALRVERRAWCVESRAIRRPLVPGRRPARRLR